LAFLSTWTEGQACVEVKGVSWKEEACRRIERTYEMSAEGGGRVGASEADSGGGAALREDARRSGRERI
jgi:hypothetical protein